MPALLVMLACGLGGGPDPDEVQHLARAHHEALQAAMPPAEEDCDGVDRLLAGGDPRGCRFRPTSTLEEVVQVVSRCSRPARSDDLEDVLWQAAYGVWTGSPQAINACSHQIGKLSRELRPNTEHIRPPLPDLRVAAHGARWHAALAALADDAPDTLIRGWLEVERALGHCGDIAGPGCVEVFSTRGVHDQRIHLDQVASYLQKASSGLDHADRITRRPR